MSEWRTNRRTGGVFPTSEIGLEHRRRYACHICQAMMGPDMPSEVAESQTRIVGREPAGTPLSTFVSRRELNDHIKLFHQGKRLPQQAHRRIGRGPVTVNVTQTTTPTQTNTPPETQTVTETETVTPETATEPDEITEIESEPVSVNITPRSADQGFTDDDDQVFDGDGGVI